MKTSALVIIAYLFLITPSVAGGFTNRFPVITTLNGHTYSNARPKRVEANHLIVYHSKGIAKIHIMQVPDAVCTAIGIKSPSERKRERAEFVAAQQAKGLVPYRESYGWDRTREIWITPEEKAKREKRALQIAKDAATLRKIREKKERRSKSVDWDAIGQELGRPVSGWDDVLNE